MRLRIFYRQVVLGHPRGDLRSSGQRQLAQNVADMGLCGALADDQFACDLRVTEPASHEECHLTLARSQAVRSFLS